MRTRYRIIAEKGIYFITSTTVEWLPVFTSNPYFDILIEFSVDHLGGYA